MSKDWVLDTWGVAEWEFSIKLVTITIPEVTMYLWILQYEYCILRFKKKREFFWIHWQGFAYIWPSKKERLLVTCGSCIYKFNHLLIFICDSKISWTFTFSHTHAEWEIFDFLDRYISNWGQKGDKPLPILAHTLNSYSLSSVLLFLTEKIYC